MRQTPLLLGTLILAACSEQPQTGSTGVTQPEPPASITLFAPSTLWTFVDQPLNVAGVAATVRDQFGNSVQNASLTWSVAPTAALSVVNDTIHASQEVRGWLIVETSNSLRDSLRVYAFWNLERDSIGVMRVWERSDAAWCGGSAGMCSEPADSVRTIFVSDSIDFREPGECGTSPWACSVGGGFDPNLEGLVYDVWYDSLATLRIWYFSDGRVDTLSQPNQTPQVVFIGQVAADTLVGEVGVQSPSARQEWAYTIVSRSPFLYAAPGSDAVNGGLSDLIMQFMRER